MKNLSKILLGAFLFSVAIAFGAYAEEVKTEKVSDVVVATPAVASAPAMTAAVVPTVLPVLVEKTTLDNLQAAFNGESNAHARYLAFAVKADAEGYGKVASLFRAAARAEQVHFERHAKVIKELKAVPSAKIETPVVKSTVENLKAAMQGEIYENTVMYPEFIVRAKKDKNANALDAFEDAQKAEGVHAALYQKALMNLPAWKGKNKNFYVCPFCGNVVEKSNFKNCPICGESKKKFMTVK